MRSVALRTPLLLPALSAAMVGLFMPSCSETGTTVSDSGAITTTRGWIPDLIRARRERDRGPLPESEWNKYRTWKKIQVDPPTYIPAQYSKNAPRTTEKGQWFVDHRDGKRLYVPNTIEGDYTSTILAVEAAKVIDWQYSKGKKWYHSVEHRE